ncbi:MAG: Hsp20 family protein [Chloroflexi bacterium]|nr:Hsp20 family protein [Chloroflexota bacterium]
MFTTDRCSTRSLTVHGFPQACLPRGRIFWDVRNSTNTPPATRRRSQSGGTTMADIVRWDPFESFMTARQMMNRLLEDAWVRPMAPLAGEIERPLSVDVYETDDEVVVTAPVPGVKPEDIDVSIQGNSLSIKGETKMERDVSEENFYRRERRYGKFGRQIMLPTVVQSERAEARFENGVLTLHMPKAEEVRPRKIQIKAAA